MYTDFSNNLAPHSLKTYITTYIVTGCIIEIYMKYPMGLMCVRVRV